MKYLVYLLTLLFSTAVAQSPTILQGNYVSNVFGQANFVKNPNAQTNVANVTVSSATVTRPSPMVTPLVATTEFNVEVTSANGTITWATRSFDAGMKNQNCEARFSYRGFQATSKAQIKQGANVIAELTLTPSATDPRIASINFPCGDLSAATTFVITDSATLSGVHEIGGIYVGLATNQANVAQAEVVGGVEFSPTTIAGRVLGPAGYWTKFTGTTGTATPFGKASSASINLDVTFPALPAGEYDVKVDIPFFIYGGTGGHACRIGIRETTSGQWRYLHQSGSRGADINEYLSINSAGARARFEFTGAATTRTFEIVAANSGWVSSANGECYVERPNSNSSKVGISVYRFPSSSELVVTPERQNTFGGVRYAGSTDFTRTAPATDVKINTTAFGAATAIGKAQVTSLTDCGLAANDIGFCVQNVPPGSYVLTANLQIGAQTSSGTPGSTTCSLSGFASGTTLSATRISSSFVQQIGVSQEDWAIASSGVLTVSSFQPQLAVYYAIGKNSSTGTCIVRSAASGVNVALPSFTIQPLDQPSNSALYVQGPVKAAATGTAIPAGSIGEEQIGYATYGVFTTTTTANSEIDVTGATITLTPGVWDLEYSASVFAYRNPASTASIICRLRVRDSANNNESLTASNFGVFNGVSSTAWTYNEASKGKRINVTTTTTYKLSLISNVNNTSGLCQASTGNTTGGISGDESTTYIRAVRIN
jgi:hypothetical protein